MPGPAFVRTGFADEIADDLETQLDVLTGLGIDYLDLRSVWGTNVLDLDPDEVATVEAALDRRGVAVSAIGSPVGKVGITDPFEPHRDRFETALDRAARFGADYVRVFSYWIPEGDDPAAHRTEVMRRMQRKADLAADAGITLVHENEKDVYGDTPARVRDLVTTVDSPHLRTVFDPANYLEVGVRPYPDALLRTAEFVEYLHVKDAAEGERGAIRPAGEGDGRIPETLAALAARGFEGFASLEPHLAEAGTAGGFSGPEGFERAAAALADCFEAAGVRYH
ncbi:MAG: sugar phosphate isomerase/epimerase family protein [Halobacteriaceae archaeon]